MPKKNSENGRGGSIALLRCGRASDFVGTLHENETLRFLAANLNLQSRWQCGVASDQFGTRPSQDIRVCCGTTILFLVHSVFVQEAPAVLDSKKLTRVISCRAAHSILICNPDVVLSFTIGNYFLSVSYSVCFYVGSISFSPWKCKVLDCCFCKTKARTNNNHNPWNCAQGLTIDFPISTTGSQYNVALSVRRKT